MTDILKGSHDVAAEVMASHGVPADAVSGGADFGPSQPAPAAASPASAAVPSEAPEPAKAPASSKPVAAPEGSADTEGSADVGKGDWQSLVEASFGPAPASADSSAADPAAAAAPPSEPDFSKFSEDARFHWRSARRGVDSDALAGVALAERVRELEAKTEELSGEAAAAWEAARGLAGGGDAAAFDEAAERAGVARAELKRLEADSADELGEREAILFERYVASEVAARKALAERELLDRERDFSAKRDAWKGESAAAAKRARDESLERVKAFSGDIGADDPMLEIYAYMHLNADEGPEGARARFLAAEDAREADVVGFLANGRKSDRVLRAMFEGLMAHDGFAKALRSRVQRQEMASSAPGGLAPLGPQSAATPTNSGNAAGPASIGGRNWGRDMDPLDRMDQIKKAAARMVEQYK